MKASRGMGAISPSKMPKAKTLTRKDNPGKVKMYNDGGSVKGDFDRINKLMTRPRPKAEPKKEKPLERLPVSDEDIVGKKPLVSKAKGGKVRKKK